MLDCEEQSDAVSVTAGEGQKGERQDTPRVSLFSTLPFTNPPYPYEKAFTFSGDGHSLEPSVMFSRAPEASVPLYYTLNKVQ